MYVCLIPEFNGANSGVYNKVTAQHSAFMNNYMVSSHKTLIYTFGRKSSFPENKSDKIIVFEAKKSKNKLARKTEFLKSALHEILEYNPDYVYIRYPLSSYALFQFFRVLKRHKVKIITEFQTIEENELRIANNIVSKIKLYIEMFFRKFTLKYIDVVVGVTNEIIEHKRRIINNDHVLFYVMGNGIDCSKIPTIKETNPTQLNLVYLGNVTHWSGIDTIITELDKMSWKYYEKEIVFHVIGTGLMYDDFKNKYESSRVIFHGFLNLNDIREILGKSDIAFGSFSPETRGIVEGSNLKNREYAINGLPIIKKDLDVDFDYNVNTSEFYYNYSNEGFDLAFSKLIHDIEFKRNIQKFAIETLSWESKISRFIDFVIRNQ